MQGSPADSQHLQPLLTIRRDFEPLLQTSSPNHWERGLIDFDDWSSASRFWYGSLAFVPAGFAMVILDVNPIVFGDEFDGVRGKEMGVGRDAHFCEDLAAGGEIAGKRSVGDASYTGQF